jgi:hypothetical protein
MALATVFPAALPYLFPDFFDECELFFLLGTEVSSCLEEELQAEVVSAAWTRKLSGPGSISDSCRNLLNWFSAVFDFGSKEPATSLPPTRKNLF